MADQFHDDIPVATNQVSADIEDMKEMFGFLKDCFQNFCTGWSDTDATSLYPDEIEAGFDLFGGSSAVDGDHTIAEFKKMFVM